MVELINEGIA